jgi:hypothetical protein
MNNLYNNMSLEELKDELNFYKELLQTIPIHRDDWEGVLCKIDELTEEISRIEHLDK